MKTYRLLVKGQNFLIRVDGRTQKHGFYENLFIESDSHRQAEQLAIAKLWHCRELKQATLNAQNDPPRIVVETIWELDPLDERESVVPGRTFFPEKRWWQFWK